MAEDTSNIFQSKRIYIAVCLFALFFFIPANVIFAFLLTIHKQVHATFFGGSSIHSVRVHKIQSQLQKWNKLPKEKRKLLCSSRPNWKSLSTTFFRKDLCYKIELDLNDILELNVNNMTVRVEPMVTVGDIIDYLIPKGYVLATTIEISDATLGGLALATGMTTHSHKVGLYHENVVSYDVILSDGTLVTASEHENEDLYKTLPFSHGSLGFLVALTIKIVPVQPYVKLKYIPIKGQKKYCDYIRKISGGLNKYEKVPDYIEATIYDKDNAVVTIGDYSNYDPSLTVNHLTRWYKPWFHKYMQTFINKGTHTELVPIKDYLLRHDRSIFWVLESMVPFGNNPIFRYLFGWSLPLKPAFLKFTTTSKMRLYMLTKKIFQDIVLPIDELEKQINTTTNLFDCYPLLVYPCKIYDHGINSGQLRQPNKKYLVQGTDYAMYNDLGIYGVPAKIKRNHKYNLIKAIREMESFTRQHAGFSFLYADIFLTRSEFEEMFDLTLYEQVRKKYKAEEAFPHLYDKVKLEFDLSEVTRANTSK